MISYIVSVKMVHRTTLCVLKQKAEFDTFEEAVEFLKKESFTSDFDTYIKIKKVHK